MDWESTHWALWKFLSLRLAQRIDEPTVAQRNGPIRGDAPRRQKELRLTPHHDQRICESLRGSLMGESKYEPELRLTGSPEPQRNLRDA